MTRQETMSREEAVRTISRISGGSVSYAEDLYDSFFPKPVVPQYVADWYEGHKEDFNESVWWYLVNWGDEYWDGFKNWMAAADKNRAITTLINMHQFGYEVENEARYMVQVKGVSEINRYLNKENGKEFLFSDSGETEDYQTKFTRKELEEADFGWVFDCPGVEVTEVTDGND